MEVRGTLDIAGVEKLSADPTVNNFTSRLYWNTTSEVLRIYANGVWNTVGSIGQASGTVKYELQIDGDLDLSGTTADTIKYGYLMYPTTSGNDVARTITTPTVASGEFDQVALELTSYYFSTISIQSPDGKLFRKQDGTTSATLDILSNEHYHIFYDPDIGSGEWVVTESSQDDETKMGQIKRVSANLDMTDFYYTNQKANSTSRFDVPISIINESVASGTVVTLFDGTSTDAFIAKKQIYVYNPTAYTIDLTAFTAQTIKNNFTGVSQATWTLGAGKYLVLGKAATQYEIVDTSDTAISQLSAGGGLVLEVLTGPVTQTLEWGKHYLLDSTGGSSSLTLPATAGLTTVQQEQAKLRIHDISLDWDTNPCTVIPPSGSSIRNGAVDEEWVLNSQDTWYLFSRVSDTAISMEHPFTPQIDSGGSGSGEGRVNLFSNSNFESGLDGWTSTKSSQISTIAGGSQLEGEQSLGITSDGAGQIVSTTLTISDEAYKTIQHGVEGLIEIPSTASVGDWVARFKRNGTTIANSEADLGPGKNYLKDLMAGFAPLGDTISFEIEDVSAANSDVATCDIFVLTPQGQGSVREWPSYDQSDLTITANNGGVLGNYWVIPKKSADGKIFIEFNLHLSTMGAGDTGITFPGLTFKTGQTYQNINASSPNVSGSAPDRMRADGGTAIIYVRFAVNPVEGTVYGSLELDSWPTWATKGGNIQLLDNNRLYENASIRYYLASNLAYTGNTDIVWDTKSTALDDVGNISYSSGQFTIPYSGRFSITSNLRLNSAVTGYIQAVVGGTAYNIGYVSSGNGVSGNITLRVNAGQTVSIRLSVSDTILNLDTRSWVEITRLPDSTGNQATGAGTDEAANENPQKVLVNAQKKSIDLDSDFTAGTVKCVRGFEQITIASTVLPTHASDNRVFSSVGFIPEEYRPVVDMYTTYFMDGTALCYVGVLSDGQLEVRYIDWDGNNVSRTDTLVNFNLSYPIGD